MTLTPPSNIAPATVAVVGPVAVTGPLTDAQLRASAVGVSGPLTDAQLRAAVVPVGDGGGSLTVDGTVAATQGTSPWVVGDGGGSLSVDDNGGSLTVDGPLTDAELLAAGLATEATLETLATAAGQAALTAALAGLSTEETLAAVNEAINDVALTAILERDKLEP